MHQLTMPFSRALALTVGARNCGHFQPHGKLTNDEGQNAVGIASWRTDSVFYIIPITAKQVLPTI